MTIRSCRGLILELQASVHAPRVAHCTLNALINRKALDWVGMPGEQKHQMAEDVNL